MYFFDSKNHTDLVDPKYIDIVIKHKYKNTPFAIIKEGKSGAKWTIYIIFELNGDMFISGYGNYYTKKSAINEIESKNIFKHINKEFENLNILHRVLNSYYNSIEL